jgi:hypothetical protein
MPPTPRQDSALARNGVALALAGTVLAGLLSSPAVAADGNATDPWLYLSVARPGGMVQADDPGEASVVPVMLRLPSSGPAHEPTDAEMAFQTAQSVACVVTGGVATAAALGLGWQNVTNLISGGGAVPAAGPGVVALGLFGVVFTSFCAIGQALTPLYLDFMAPLEPAPAVPPPAPGVSCKGCAVPRMDGPTPVSRPFIEHAEAQVPIQRHPFINGCAAAGTRGGQAGLC